MESIALKLSNQDSCHAMDLASHGATGLNVRRSQEVQLNREQQLALYLRQRSSSDIKEMRIRFPAPGMSLGNVRGNRNGCPSNLSRQSKLLLARKPAGQPINFLSNRHRLLPNHQISKVSDLLAHLIRLLLVKFSSLVPRPLSLAPFCSRPSSLVPRPFFFSSLVPRPSSL